jgi:beta-glucosidase
LYPFGYGLSYTTFEYGDIKLIKEQLKGNETLTASIAVTNTGKYAGGEKVQLYITDPVASVTRSVKDLRGVQKIFLKPGERKTVSFTITTDDLLFFNSDLKQVWEPGSFIIRIGPNSRDLESAEVDWGE